MSLVRSWSCGMPPHIHEIMMKTIERVRENPDLPWAKLNPLSHPAVKESLDYWLEDALLENSVSRMTMRIRCVFFSLSSAFVESGSA